MKNSVVVDTNVILRWLLGDDPTLSARAATFWQAVIAGNESAFIAEAVFAETVFALQHHYRVDRAAIRHHLVGLIGIRHVDVANAPVMAEALGLYESTRALSFIDAVSLAHAHHRGQPLMSFDQALNKAHKRLTTTP